MKVTYILSKRFVAQKPAFIGKCFAGGWGVAKVSSLIAKKQQHFIRDKLLL